MNKYLLGLLLLVLSSSIYAEDVDCVDCASKGRAPAVILLGGATNATEMAQMTEQIQKEVGEQAVRALSSNDEYDETLETLENNIEHTP